jgi:hypothetical protein
MPLFTEVRVGETLEINGSRVVISKSGSHRLGLLIEDPTDFKAMRPNGVVRYETTKDKMKSTENP